MIIHAARFGYGNNLWFIFNYNINRTNQPALHIDLNAVLNLIYMPHALHIRRVRRDKF